ncbi:MAG TPA: sigma-54 dependent transcriptional regulator [Bdellovibrionota bacterium]|jgi:DNA-binding NtrC family response regulator|nr:sigma-54 dependent transcriptional regulator [Bdellovibrionota bacterium]
MSISRLKLVVVEDDPLMISSFKMILEGEHDTKYFTNLADALASDDLDGVQALILDLCHPGDRKGTETIAKIPLFKQAHPTAYVCIQSGMDDLDLMKSAIKAGADRYLLKDSIALEVPMLLERVSNLQKSRAAVESALVGVSSMMQRLRRDVLLLRSDSVDVLIEGETGTGKEVCAKALHLTDPFIAVNCSAIPPELFESEFFGHEKGSFSGAHQTKVGYLESAGGGTLFLDEVQSLSGAHQAKLLRVLEERNFMRVGSQKLIPFGARVISAANENLREKIRRGGFREDLYFRLAPLRLELPPLRSRREDIPELLKLFLKQYDPSGTKKFSKTALSYLADTYDWPGNVRQVRGLVQALCLRSPIPIFDEEEIKLRLNSDEQAWSQNIAPAVNAATAADGNAAAFRVDWSLGLDENVGALEKHLMLEASRRHGTPGAIEVLKISKSRFYEKLKAIKG